jgi:phosphoglycerate dehydrogenase-like enzyme
LITNVAILGLGSIGMRHAGNIESEQGQVIGYDPKPEWTGTDKMERAFC